MNFLQKFGVIAAASIASFNASAIEISDDLDLWVTASALSDYRSLGVSQTLGDPALQLQGTLMHSSGLYAGLWTSSFDFGGPAKREDGYYAGYYHAINDDVSFDISIGRYEYRKQSAFDMTELYGEINAYNVKVGYIYDYEMDGHAPNFSSVFAGYTFSLPYESSLYLKYGYSNYNFDIYTSSGDTRQTYYDWEATLSKNIAGIDVGLSYVDTDMSKSECMSAMGYDDICSATMVVKLSKTF